MYIISALALFYNRGYSHTDEHKDVKGEYNLFYHNRMIAFVLQSYNILLIILSLFLNSFLAFV